MRCLLFRKLEISGVTYYQFYKIDDKFEVNEYFSDYEHRDDTDYFYVPIDESKNVEEKNLNDLFFDQNGKFYKLQSGELFDIVSRQFEYAYDVEDVDVLDEEDNLLDNNDKQEIREIANYVEKQIMFQHDSIVDFIRQLYHNQKILDDDINLKSNILFHGPKGNGKRTFIELLKQKIKFPYAEIKSDDSIEKMVESICEQLCDNNKVSSLNYGIVFINNNMNDLRELYDDDCYSGVMSLTRKGKQYYKGSVIDFDKLTFVIVFDEFMYDDNDEEKIEQIKNQLNCQCRIPFDELYDNSKMEILLSENGKLNVYQKMLNKYGKKLIVDKNSLKKLIAVISNFLPGMEAINLALESVMRECICNGLNDLIIDDDYVNEFLEENELMDEFKKESTVNNPVNEVINETASKLLPKVLETVVGQDEHVKRILYTIMENQRMANDKTLDNPKKYIDNILIRGESGSGKTLIIETISKLLNIPFYSADATQFTEAGYQGANVEDMLVGLLHNAGGDKEKAQKGILDMDEIDKKAGHGDIDVSRGAVQNGLLKIVEGATIPINVGDKLYPEIVNFDTSRLTVIGKGAFEGIEKIRDDRVRKATGHTLGFNNEVKDVFVDKELTDDDFVNYGMQRQFMARLPIKIELNKNSVDTLKEIMLKSKISALKIQKYKLESNGIEVEYTPDFYDELAKYAYNMKIGARGIEKALQKVLTNIHIEDIEPGEVSKLIFTGEVVSDPSKIVIIKKEKEEQKVKMKTR